MINVFLNMVLVAFMVLSLTCYSNEDNTKINVSELTLHRMASVAKGEDGVDPSNPACVMRNRILNGWNPELVLNHFYASPRDVSQEEYDRVRDTVLLGVDCDKRAYFQWSLSDENNIRPNPASFLYEVNGNVYYDINALR